MSTKFKQLKFTQLARAINGGKTIPIERLGRRMKDIRETVGMTQKQMAKRLKISQSAISQIEENASSSSLKTILKYLSVLGLNLASVISSPVPLERVIAEKAERAAKRLVDRTYANMAMEKQAPASRAYQQEIKRLKAELSANPGPELWEE
jgi:transcriptional regulator with XRE-family HTH domain